jgi:hypothetical protein
MSCNFLEEGKSKQKVYAIYMIPPVLSKRANCRMDPYNSKDNTFGSFKYVSRNLDANMLLMHQEHKLLDS